VLLDVEEYEALVDQVELLRDVQTAEKQLKRDASVSNAKARTKVLARFRK
jgi:PHD/YefM family antitoxin component YafN of YafNO toxin-antitoxin module